MEYFNDILTQVTNLGPEALVGIMVIAIGYVLRPIKAVPNKAIPFACLVLGAVIYPLIAKPVPVSADLRHPLVRQVLEGLLIGLLAWLCHNLILKRLEDKLPWLKGVLDAEGSEPPATTQQPTKDDTTK